MIESGSADIMPAAAQNPERDKYALFVPTHRVRPMLITLDRARIDLASAADLLRLGLHVGVVHSYDFGAAYREMVAELARRNKLHTVADPGGIARLLRTGRIEAAVLPPTAFADAGEIHQLADRIRLRALPELAQVRVGFYLSRTVLDGADRTLLQEAMRQAIAGGAYARAMRQHYPPWALQDVGEN
jgi:polar amino acid transport system substrate-binding protein